MALVLYVPAYVAFVFVGFVIEVIVVEHVLLLYQVVLPDFLYTVVVPPVPLAYV